MNTGDSTHTTEHRSRFYTHPSLKGHTVVKEWSAPKLMLVITDPADHWPPFDLRLPDISTTSEPTSGDGEKNYLNATVFTIGQKEAIDEVLDGLNEKEKIVIRARFGLDD